MDFFNANLPWRNFSNRDEVAEIKQKCLRNPIEYLWNNPVESGQFDYKIKDIKQLKDIFYHIQNLKYESEPNYQLIRMLLLEIRNDYLRQANPQISRFETKLPKEPPTKITPEIENSIEAFLMKHLAEKEGNGLIRDLYQSIYKKNNTPEILPKFDCNLNQGQTDGPSNLKFMLNQKREEYLKEI